VKASAVVKTEVEVDLSDFTTHDLIVELESRGHAVDADCAADLGTADLLSELSKRAYSANFPKLPLDMLIRYLRDYSCPAELIAQLEAWASEPVPTLKKLEEWLAACSS
jgi:hypothetical protein